MCVFLMGRWVSLDVHFRVTLSRLLFLVVDSVLETSHSIKVMPAKGTKTASM